jgi:hypothetical protein
MFRFRKRIKILPGLHLNVGQKGISSVSIGPRGATVGLSKRGWTQSIATPISGLSYRRSGKWATNEDQAAPAPAAIYNSPREPLNLLRPVVAIVVGVGLLISFKAARPPAAPAPAPLPVAPVEVRKAIPAEVRKAVPVEVRKAVAVKK